jgi:2-C-methyl-D-erythritol 4-phosphate cytidylyltransferase
MPVKDTIQLVDDKQDIISTPIRKQTWLAQTPQCFSYELAMSSYNKVIEAKDADITDDAMVVQRYGNVKVRMLEGSYENIKVTTPEDIPVAECFLEMR